MWFVKMIILKRSCPPYKYYTNRSHKRSVMTPDARFVHLQLAQKFSKASVASRMHVASRQRLTVG